MPQQTFGVGTVPLVLNVGERVTLICSSGCAGFISVPGEAVAQTITAGTSYDYGGYSVQREVVLSVSAGTVAVNFNIDGSQFWTQSQADSLQALVSGYGKLVHSSTWGVRPLANLSVGDRAYMTDVGQGGSEWVWDGTYWIPAAPVVLFRAAGTVAAPLATLTGVTSGTFATPGNVPAGMFIKPGMKLSAEARFRRSTAAATGAILAAAVGGSHLSNNAIANAVGQTAKLMGDMLLVTASTQTIDQFQSLNTSTLNAIIDASVNFNNAQSFTLTLSGANASDSFTLLSYSLTIHP